MKENPVSSTSIKYKIFSGDMLILAFSVAYIAAFCLLGLYITPTADDYNLADAVHKYGYWGAQVYFYHWTPAPASFIFSCLPAAIGLNFLGVLPSVTCFFYLSVFYISLRITVKHLSKLQTLKLSLLLLAAWLAFVPALNEVFYWLCAMPYTWNQLFIIMTAAFFYLAFNDKKFILPFLFLVVFSALFGPQDSIFLCTIFFVLFFAYAFTGNKRGVFLSLIALLAAFSGFLILFLAPAARMEGMRTLNNSLPQFLRTIGVAASFGGITALKFFTKPVIYVFLLFLPSIAQALQPFDSKISRRLRTWHIVFLTALIAPLMHSIAGWATGAGLPERAESLTLWMMGLTWVFMWSFGYRNEAFFERVKALRLFRWRGALLVLCLLLSSNFIALIKDLQIAPIYRSELAARDAMVQQEKSKGHLDITVPLLTVKPKLLFFSDLRPSSLDWKNASYAEYHGINSVSALPIKIFTDEAEKRAFESGSLEGFKKLAAKGDSETPFMLGEIYDTTFAELKGITKDNAEAAKWYLMAAERSNTHACRRLTRLYATGSGVPKNYLTAVYWLLRAQL